MEKQEVASVLEERRKANQAVLTPEVRARLDRAVSSIIEDIADLQSDNWCESCLEKMRDFKAQLITEGKNASDCLIRVCSSCGSKLNLIEELFRASGIDISYEADDDFVDRS